MIQVFRVASFAVLGLVLGTPVMAQQKAATPKPTAMAKQQAAAPTVPVTEARPGLQQMAKITPQAAEATALASVKNGKITSARIMQEPDSSLVYDFKITAAGKEHDVQVNANTGKRVSAMSPKKTSHPASTGKS